MNEKELLKALALPPETYVLRTFPYNKMEPLLTTKQKKLFSDVVISRGIRVLASLNSVNTNIPRYEDEKVRYEEIHFFSILVENHKYNDQIYRVFQKIMPYPLVVLFHNEKNRELWLADTNKIENGTLSINTVYVSNRNIAFKKYVEAVNFSKQDILNLYKFYTSLIQSLVNVELKETYQTESNNVLNNNLLEKIKNLDNEIDQLVNQAKKESQLNKRIELQVKANKLKEIKAQLIEGEN